MFKIIDITVEDEKGFIGQSIVTYVRFCVSKKCARPLFLIFGIGVSLKRLQEVNGFGKSG